MEQKYRRQDNPYRTLRPHKDRREGMQNIDDRFDILGITSIYDYDSMASKGIALEEVHYDKAVSIDRLRDKRKSKVSRNENIPDDVFLSRREQQTT